MPPTLSQICLLLARRLRVRPRAWQSCVRQPACTQRWQQHSQQLVRRYDHHIKQQQQSPHFGCSAVLQRWFASASDSHTPPTTADEQAAGAFVHSANSANATTTSSNNSDRRSKQHVDAAQSSANRTTSAIALDTLPALKVLSETFALLKQTHAYQTWNSTDWLVGLTVLAQHHTIERKKRNVLSILSDDANKKALANHELLTHLLKYVRICDAVYASTLRGFCREANVLRSTIVRHHRGGAFSPKFILLLDHKAHEIVVVVRGSASIMDFCTDLCLVNEPFANGQGHRGMVHAANWLANDLRDDLHKLTAAHPTYRLITTGHSLGAAVAALTTIVLRPEFPQIHCYAFATPASVTRELAIECSEYVTTVVNGDDCVPRLHQHSIYDLQTQIQTFDWRATLKQLVNDEVESQRTAVVGLSHAKFEQIVDAIRQFERRSLEQQHDALERIDSVKRFATSNITTLTNKLDERVTASVDASLATFRTDRIATNHLAFLRNLLQTDNKQKLPYLWEKLDASIVVLERLSAAVNKPDELERLIHEAKALLEHTTDAPASAQSQSSTGSMDSTKAPKTPLSLFRDRINSVIHDATELLKQQVEHTMTHVTHSVATNVSGVVASVKNEAEALSTRLQTEISATVDKVTETAVVQMLPAVEAVDSVDAMFQDLNAEVVDLAHLFQAAEDARTVDADEEESYSDRSRAAARSDHVDSRVADAALLSTATSNKDAKSDELLHAPLFPPGRILYLNRVPITDGSDSRQGTLESATGAALATVGEQVELVEVANDEFSRVVLSNQMILDHLCPTYERMLQATKILAAESPPSRSTTANGSSQ